MDIVRRPNLSMTNFGKLEPGQLERHSRVHVGGFWSERLAVDQVFVLDIPGHSSFD